MAAATVTGLYQNNVPGAKRQVGASSIVFASGSDTWVTGLAVVEVIMLTPTTNIAPAFTVSGGTVTAVTAGTYRGMVQGY
jgi:hypothetical protein